jgi:hypothetical protein
MSHQSENGRRCPVCEAALEHGASRCVRCETDLEAWWPLEDGIRGIPNGPSEAIDSKPIAVQVSRPRLHPLILGALVLGVGLGAGSHTLITSVRQPVPRPSGASTAAQASSTQLPPDSKSRNASSERPRVVLYHVQKGDSWWRISATITGRGSTWQELRKLSHAPVLKPGVVLMLPLSDDGRLASEPPGG